MKQPALLARPHACLLVMSLAVLVMGCAGGFVYGPSPEPKQVYPVDISVEQKIYQATTKKKKQKNAVPAPEPAQAAQPPQQASPPSEQHFYSVHVLSFKNPEYARNAAQRLAGQTGTQAFVRDAELPGSGTWHRVYVGRFFSESEAEACGENLKQRGLTTYAAVHALSVSRAADQQR